MYTIDDEATDLRAKNNTKGIIQKSMKKIGLFFVLCFTLLACDREQTQLMSINGLTKVDTSGFRQRYHFWVNEEFLLTDSLILRNVEQNSQVSQKADSLSLQQGVRVLVLNIEQRLVANNDSLQVLISADYEHWGWVGADEFSQKILSTHWVSRLFWNFSQYRGWWLGLIVGCGLLFLLWRKMSQGRWQIVHFNDMKSFYPTLLCLVVSASALLYGSLREFTPNVWRVFFVDPTLNPFTYEHWSLQVFVGSLWLMGILVLAVIDDLRKHPGVINGVTYFLSLIGVCLLLYSWFSWSVRYYVGYVFLPIYYTFALYRHCCYNRSPYRCGHCGAAMQQVGKCAACGTFNH